MSPGSISNANTPSSNSKFKTNQRICTTVKPLFSMMNYHLILSTVKSALFSETANLIFKLEPKKVSFSKEETNSKVSDDKLFGKSSLELSPSSVVVVDEVKNTKESNNIL